MPNIKMVQIVTVKEVGKVYIYIWKQANEIKESGYYLILDNGQRYKNAQGETVGIYILKRFKPRKEYVEKYKLTNDSF